MFAPPSTETLNRFFLLSWLVVLWQVLRLQDGIVFDDAWLPLWSVAASLSYAFLYIVPVYLACRLLLHFHDRLPVRLSPWLAGVLRESEINQKGKARKLWDIEEGKGI